MCLILFAYKKHPKYKLILAANRDEFKARPTAKAGFWEDKPQLLAGRDLEQLGTWLGISKAGKFSALTNYREPHEHIIPNAPSRGDLTANFLKENIPPAAYLQALLNDQQVFNGYNLLLGDVNALYHYSNREEKMNRLSSGVYGLSNHLLDTPWPKVSLGKALLEEQIKQKEPDVLSMFELLQNTNQPPDFKLPNTGVGLDLERMLGPMFIDSPNYGTYCSTVLLWSEDNQVDFYEKIHADQSIQHFQFQVETSSTTP